ncbi:hypothetical protein ZHAS_00018621 [Anopheles sinensis]|uniref:Uncharacterized protein n=1 Tax=Anopheles sinensis TaxID=74873 RepID=A0A084WJF6_ANOSI|nr:hypothetical protein ZHAS_00018621 [Anopheles sinensis]
MFWSLVSWSAVRASGRVHSWPRYGAISMWKAISSDSEAEWNETDQPKDTRNEWRCGNYADAWERKRNACGTAV